MEKGNELREMGEAVSVIAHVVGEELRERLVPSPAQWARAQALREAREWVMASAAGPYALVDGVPIDHASSVLVEQLTLRWARLVETGSAE